MLPTRTVGRGARVVLVHGFTQTAASWSRVAAPLARRGFEVVAVDLPGHGGASKVEADLSTAGRLVVDAGGPGAYVGYSLGGRVVLHAALAQPHLVSRLVLESTTAGIDDPDGRAARVASDEALARQLEADGDVAAFLDRWLAGPLFATLPAEAAGLEERLTNTAAGLASSLRLAGAGRQEPLWERVDELNMPVLVIAGERDEKFLAAGRRLVERIGSNATLHVASGAGHAVHLEQPDRFTDVVAEFLRPAG